MNALCWPSRRWPNQGLSESQYQNIFLIFGHWALMIRKRALTVGLRDWSSLDFISFGCWMTAVVINDIDDSLLLECRFVGLQPTEAVTNHNPLQALNGSKGSLIQVILSPIDHGSIGSSPIRDRNLCYDLGNIAEQMLRPDKTLRFLALEWEYLNVQNF